MMPYNAPADSFVVNFRTFPPKELGTLKDFELEIRFKPQTQPVFHKPRPVPIAVQEDLEAALQAGITKGIWEPTQFNSYGTPVAPIKKTSKSGPNSIITG